MDGYNFTERVRKVLALAREESARLRHEYVGTEHILLGLIAEGEGVAATVLANLGADIYELKDTIERTVKKGTSSTTGPDLPYTSRSKKVLELSMSQARAFRHTYVGTEHLLLGLIAEGKGIAAQVLAHANVNSDNAAAETLRILGWEGSGIPIVTGAEPPKPPLTARLTSILSQARMLPGHAGPVGAPLTVAIAVLKHGQGAAHAALTGLGVDFAAVVAALEAAMAHELATAAAEGSVPEGEAFRAVVERAELERRTAGAAACGTGHVLVALLETTPAVAGVFKERGIEADALRRELLRISG